MSESTSQTLESILADVTKAFADHKTISVSPSVGDAPDQYTVVYQINSVFKDDNGNIKELQSSEVLINIPFGFPRFPPTCKPLTSVYHPDFDPSAIHIDNFWKKSQSIVELIIHIGKMISGEIYSIDNTFNSDAVDWYKANSHNLPFEQTSHSSIENHQETTVEEPFDEDTLDELLLDPLDDADLDSDIDYLSLEESDKAEAPVENSITPDPDIPSLSLEQTSTEDGDKLAFDVYQVPFMVQQKQFHKLLLQLRGIAPNAPVEDKEEIIAEAEKAVNNATRLYQKGKELESQSLNHKALQCYKEAEAFVSDFPDISESIARLHTLSDSAAPERTNKTTVDEAAVDSQAEQQTTAAKGRKDLTFYHEDQSKPFNPLPFIGLFGLIAIIGFFTLSYLYFNSKMNSGQELLALCNKSIQDNRPDQAKNHCDQALDNINKVLFIQQSKKKAVKTQISSALNSIIELDAHSAKGANNSAGQSNIPNQAYFDKLLLSASQKMGQSDWTGAVEDYKQSRKIGANLSAIDADKLKEIDQNIALGQTKIYLNNGQEEMANSQWPKAIDSLGKALEIIKLKPEIKAQEDTAVEDLLSEAKFHNFYDLGHKLLQEGKWSPALNNLNQALSIDRGKIPIPPASIEQLKKDIHAAQLYFEIESGKNASTQGLWDKALAHYNSAVQLMKSNRQGSNAISTEQHHSRLSRIMLNISVVRDRQQIVKYSEKKQFSQASAKLAAIIKYIKNSPFGQENEFKTILAESRQALVDTKLKLDILTAEQYLKENYKSLFIQNYPSSTPASLSKIKTTFIKKSKDELVFNLQCVDTSGGRALRLILDYSYNVRTKKWRPHSEQE